MIEIVVIVLRIQRQCQADCLADEDDFDDLLAGATEIITAVDHSALYATIRQKLIFQCIVDGLVLS